MLPARRSRASPRSVGRAAPASAGVASARSSPFSARHSEQIQQDCARSCPPAGPQPRRWQAGWRVSEETGTSAGPEGELLSAITAGCVSVVAMLILGPVITPGNRLPGRLPSLLPGVCGPAGYRRAAGGIG